MFKKAKICAAIAVSALVAISYCIAADQPAFAEDAAGAKASAVGQVSLEIEKLVEVTGEDGAGATLEEIGEDAYDGFICVLDADAEQVAEMEEKIEEIDDPEACEQITDTQIHAESLEVIEEITQPEMIEYIEPDYILRPMAFKADPLDAHNRAIYNIINIAPVWQLGIDGRGQNGKKTPVVAVMDSGVIGGKAKSERHQDLNYGKITRLKSKRFRSYDDDFGHGTFVTGEIAAVAGNGKGVTGLMPGVKIISVKTMNRNGGTVSDAVAAMKKLTKKRVDVINMSFGTAYYSKSFAAACKKAASKGIILVAAAGNDGNGLYYYPAGYDGVVGVGSVTGSGKLSRFSERNDSVDVVAPGKAVFGLGYMYPSNYTVMSGTSISAPMVSALAAMVKSYRPAIKHKGFMKILKATSTDKGRRGYDKKYGFGIINFGRVQTFLASGQALPKTSKASMKKPGKGKVKSVKSGRTSVKLKAKKLKRATSYQISLRQKGGKTFLLRTVKRSCRIYGLQPHRTYYVKVRGIRNVDGVNCYGKWSKTKKFRTK